MSASFYEEVEIEDMEYDPESQSYTYPCPCGDKFVITLEEMYDGEDIGICPSCTLRIRVVFDEESLPTLLECSSEDGQDNPPSIVPSVSSFEGALDVSLEALKVSSNRDGDINKVDLAASNQATEKPDKSEDVIK
jgi:diphthamide biosynthesis protein 3